ncbi:MAG: mRNA interferase RelE/StbE [Candidatus Omnitrophota bacterium]
MKYTVIIPPDVFKVIQVLSPTLKKQIRAALDSIEEDPYQGKALKDKLKGLFSFRVSRYRIIYKVIRNKVQIQIIDIGHRANIYQRITSKPKNN